MEIEYFVVGLLFSIFGVIIGSIQADHSALKDCAAKGQVKLSGIVVDCEVVKEKK